MGKATTGPDRRIGMVESVRLAVERCAAITVAMVRVMQIAHLAGQDERSSGLSD